VVQGDKGEFRVKGGQIEPLAGSEWVEASPRRSARPGRLTWLVNTVRRVPWIGKEPIAWLEQWYFGLKDDWERLEYRFFGPEGPELTTRARPSGPPDAQAAPRSPVSLTA